MPVATTGERSGLLKKGKKKKPNDYGTGIPQHEIENIARILLPDILAFYESEEGQREFAEWKAQQAEKPDKEIAAQAADYSNPINYCTYPHARNHPIQSDM